MTGFLIIVSFGMFFLVLRLIFGELDELKQRIEKLEAK